MPEFMLFVASANRVCDAHRQFALHEAMRNDIIIHQVHDFAIGFELLVITADADECAGIIFFADFIDRVDGLFSINAHIQQNDLNFFTYVRLTQFIEIASAMQGISVAKNTVELTTNRVLLIGIRAEQE